MKTVFFIILGMLFFPLMAGDNMTELEELARGYQNQGKIAQAAEFYSKAGYFYWNNENKTKAVEMFQKAYDIFSSQSNHNASLTVSNNIGLVYLDLENYNKSYNAFNNSLFHSRKLLNSTEVFNSLINLGSVALELNNYNDAVSKALEALNIATEINNMKGLSRTYGLLAESYEKIGDATNAYKYYELYSTLDKKIKAQEMENFRQNSEEEVRKANELKRVTEIELKIKTGELKITQDSLAISERLSYERQMQIDLRNAQLKEKEVELRYERHLRTTLIGGIVVVSLFFIGLGFMFRQKIKDNKVLKSQKEEITLQRNRLDIQNKKITDSIHYGLRIQKAMLPNESKLNDKLETFILYQPKDIVSGDFYWYHSSNVLGVLYQFIAVADCTGHGVPGAFMSMIGHRLLTEIIIDKKISDPAVILDEISSAIKNDLNHDNNSRSTDGMDIALCCLTSIDEKYDKLVFSGAKRCLVHVSAKTKNLEVIEGDHKTIGGSSSRKSSFTNKIIKVNKGDQIYLYSDGIIDQPNENRDRFGTARFLDFVKNNFEKSMCLQKDILQEEFDKFKQGEEQRDDITVFAARLI